MKNLGEHPFSYRIDDIQKFVNDLVSIAEFDHAFESIKEIKIRFISCINSGLINSSRDPFHHLESYHASDLAHSIEGITYPDGSRYKFIYELNQLSEWVKIMQTGNKKTTSIPDKLDGIFYDPDYCYKWLKEVEPPVINQNFVYQLDQKKKFKIVAWFEALEIRGHVKQNIEKKELVKLINEKISGLNLGKDARIFRGDDKAYDFQEFKRYLISKITYFTDS